MSAGTEVAAHADFSQIRYAQCWEDADILLAGLAIRPGDTCLGIASAGDNCLAMLSADPARVIAVDLNPAQLACVELRVAAYRCLRHDELLRLVGSRPEDDRGALYRACRAQLGGKGVFVQMMTPQHTCPRITRQPMRREQELPFQFTRGRGIFSFERLGQTHRRGSLF